MLVQVRFTKTGCCSAIGNFSPGDLARIDSRMATHLVEEAKVAKYVLATKLEAPEIAPAILTLKKKDKKK